MERLPKKRVFSFETCQISKIINIFRKKRDDGDKRKEVC